jgi:uncharacterized protein (TIGR03663 family)
MQRETGWSARIRGLAPWQSVLALTALALLARLVALGSRPVHWDEARVGYWTLRTIETGAFAYHPIIHGPLIQHVNALVFQTLGADPFTMRVFVALVGGSLPLAALLFRTRLDGAEVVALAGVLAVNPLLLYYGRFMRSDVLLAAAAFVAFGAVVRCIDTGDGRWLPVAGVALSLGFASKENALLYLLAWAGAAVMVALGSAVRLDSESRWFVRRRDGRLGSMARRFAAGLWRLKGSLLLAVACFWAVFVFLYAPRASAAGGVGLWNALGNPALLPDVLAAATVGTWAKLSGLWFSPGVRNDTYLLFVGYYALVLSASAAPVVAMALVGGVRERARPLVAFCGWWGLASVVGYPYVADIPAPWLGVHVVIALAIPAAVGLVAVCRRFRRAREAGDRRTAAVFGGLLLVSAAFVGAAAGTTSYVNPPHQFNLIAQGAQPGSDLNGAMDHAVFAARYQVGSRQPTMTATATGDTARPHVAYVGPLAVADESANDDFPAAGNWYERLPLPWYTEAADLRVASVDAPADLGADPPPVIVAKPVDSDAVADRVPEYTQRRRTLFLRDRNVTIRAFGMDRTLESNPVYIFVDERGLYALAD